MGGANGDAAGREPLPKIQGDLKAWILCLTGVRLEILLALSEGPAPVCDLVDRLELGYSNISHSLRQLRRLRCVTSQRDGATRVYRLAPVVSIDSSGSMWTIVLFLPGDRRAELTLPKAA